MKVVKLLIAALLLSFAAAAQYSRVLTPINYSKLKIDTLNLPLQDTTCPKTDGRVVRTINGIYVADGTKFVSYVGGSYTDAQAVLATSYISANNFFDDGGTYKNTTALRIANTVYGLIDPYTYEAITYTKVIIKPNGVSYTDADIDGVIIRKKGVEYFKRNFSIITPDAFGAPHDGIHSDVFALKAAIKSPFVDILDLKPSTSSYFIDTQVIVNKKMFLRGQKAASTISTSINDGSAVLLLILIILKLSI